MEDPEFVVIPTWIVVLVVALSFLALLLTGLIASYCAFAVWQALSGMEISFTGVSIGGLTFAAICFWEGIKRLAVEPGS